MSAEDESLMWEILDFGCSAGGAAMKFGDLAIPRESKIQANEEHPTPRVGQQSKQAQGRGMTPNLPNLHQIPGSINEGSLPEWPFQTRGDGDMLAAMPDIPDWMILGDYMAEHL